MTVRPLLRLWPCVVSSLISAKAVAAEDPRVHVDGEGIVESCARSDNWEFVCVAPCSFGASPSLSYRVRTRAGIRGLPVPNGEAAAYRVEVTDQRGVRTGLGVASVLFVTTGLVLLAVSVVTFVSNFKLPIGCDKANNPESRCGGRDHSSGAEAVAGLVSLGIGAGFGIASALTSSTSVDLERSPTQQGAMPRIVGRTFRGPSIVFSF